jgi:hypothetical protein
MASAAFFVSLSFTVFTSRALAPDPPSLWMNPYASSKKYIELSIHARSFRKDLLVWTDAFALTMPFVLTDTARSRIAPPTCTVLAPEELTGTFGGDNWSTLSAENLVILFNPMPPHVLDGGRE